MTERFFAILATIIGLLYVALTPPFQVPDEWNHYVRAEAIAQGHLKPNMTWQGDCASFPAGIERFVRTIYRTDVPFHRSDVRQAMSIRRNEPGRSQLCFSAWYTPVPYAPQVIVAAASRLANVRPIVTFYAGRLANLAFAIVMLVLAMRMAGAYRYVIAAIALLPMAMFEVASWSPDAATFAIAVFLVATAFRPSGEGLKPVTTVVLALCKPVYFLIGFITARTRRQFVFILVAVILGVAIASSVATQARYNARYGLHVDAREQAECIRKDPARFLRIVVNTVHDNSATYAEEFIGRFGMSSLKLPVWVIWLNGALLVIIALAAPPVPVGKRLTALFIVVATFGGILLSQYLIWNIVCGSQIEGVQGRYFLPIVFLAALVLSAGVKIPQRAQAVLVTTIAIIANAVGLFVQLQHYWL